MAKYRLKDISLSKLEYGSGAAACAFDGDARYIRITDITDDGNLAVDVVSPSYYEEKHILHDGDILFARTGATVGKTFLYNDSYGKCVYAGFLIRMVPDKSKVLPEYVYYFTKSPRYSDFISLNMKVVAQPNINAKQYGDLELYVPPFAEQETIVEKLNILSKLISLRKQQLAKLDELVKARFVELMDSAELSEETTIEQITERVKVGFVGTCEKYYTDDSGIPMLRTGNITGHGIDMSDLKYVTAEFHEKNKKSQIRRGDLLIARHGSNGQANVYDGAEAQCLNAVVIVPNSAIAKSVFLAGLINSPNVKKQIDRTLVGSTQHVVNTKSIANLTVRIPCLEVQEQYEAFVEQTDKSKLTIQQSLDKLETLKKALMQKYFG